MKENVNPQKELSHIISTLSSLWFTANTYKQKQTTGREQSKLTKRENSTPRFTPLKLKHLSGKINITWKWDWDDTFVHVSFYDIPVYFKQIWVCHESNLWNRIFVEYLFKCSLNGYNYDWSVDTTMNDLFKNNPNTPKYSNPRVYISFIRNMVYWVSDEGNCEPTN